MNMAEYTKLTEFFGPCASKRGKRDIHKHITVSPYNKRKTLSWRHCKPQKFHTCTKNKKEPKNESIHFQWYKYDSVIIYF